MIEYHGHNLFLKHARPNQKILELGNQEMNLVEAQNISAKEYYSRMGFIHTSVDQNGKDGALQLDLSKPQELDEHDFVTDFGTTEHVENLYQCLKNVFNGCKVGGLMLHKNPKTGNFKGHGYHYFTTDFWKEYAYLCKLEVLEIYEHPIYHNTTDGWECIALLRKIEESKYPTKNQFETIKHLVHGE